MFLRGGCINPSGGWGVIFPVMNVVVYSWYGSSGVGITCIYLRAPNSPSLDSRGI